VGTPGPGQPLPGGRHPADLGSNPGVITTTLLSGVIAVAVAAAEWTGSGKALRSPTGILWSVVALLGVVAMLLGSGLELRRRRQAQLEVPAVEPADRPGPPRRSHLAELPTGTVAAI
jgi:hypothetical protein